MYYNTWFQKDPHFPIIAFNHEQMEESTTAGYLTKWKESPSMVSQTGSWMIEGEKVKPETGDEKLCFKLINELDHVNGHVPRSISQEKYMKNEIWTLIISP